jgi:hypothetical protein
LGHKSIVDNHAAIADAVAVDAARQFAFFQ